MSRIVTSSSFSSESKTAHAGEMKLENGTTIPVYSLQLRMPTDEDRKAKEAFIKNAERQVYVLLAENDVHGHDATEPASTAITFIRQQLDLCPRSFFKGRGRLILKYNESKREVGSFSIITLELNLVTKEALRPKKWEAAMAAVGEKAKIIMGAFGDMFGAMGSVMSDALRSLGIWLLRTLIKLIRFLDPIVQRYLGFSLSSAFWGLIRQAAAWAGYDGTVVPSIMPEDGAEFIYALIESWIDSKWNAIKEIIIEDWNQLIGRFAGAGDSVKKFMSRIGELVGEVSANDNDWM